MANKVQSKCLCGEIFNVDVRNRGRQKYCPQPRRRAAGKAARQQCWQKKPENQDYFRGAWDVQRVRDWRARHPGYWRSHRRRKAATLQDAIAATPHGLLQLGQDILSGEANHAQQASAAP